MKHYPQAIEFPITIQNGWGETRHIVTANWGGDTPFYFDEFGCAFELYADDPYHFEQLSSGDRWSA